MKGRAHCDESQVARVSLHLILLGNSRIERTEYLSQTELSTCLNSAIVRPSPQQHVQHATVPGLSMFFLEPNRRNLQDLRIP